MRDPDLWTEMMSYAFDPKKKTGQFSRHLARENGWRRDYARYVIKEYRRFLYLSSVSRTPLVPSEAVLKAWRLHLAHRQDVWVRLCPRLLVDPLVVDPKTDDVSEEVRAARYDATLDLYAKEFGGKPPRNIWPDPDVTARLRRMAGIVATMCATAFASMTVVQPQTPDPLLLPAGVLLVLALSLVVRYRNQRAHATV